MIEIQKVIKSWFQKVYTSSKTRLDFKKQVLGKIFIILPNAVLIYFNWKFLYYTLYEIILSQ